MTEKIDWKNRVGKWRAFFAGWQLGTRQKGDPESEAVRDHREATIALRCELSAIGMVLINKGLVTAKELEAAVQSEAQALCKQFEQSFPGFKAVDNGLEIDSVLAAKTTQGWKP